MRVSRWLPCMVLLPAVVGAQQRPDSIIRAPGRTIIGVVRDSADRAVDSAQVFVSDVRRTTAADSAGRFRLDDVRPGEYQIAVRRLGFYPQTRTITVSKDSGVFVTFALVPFSRPLPTVVTSARRGGLSGVVGDSSWAAIKDAEVWVSGTKRTVSDSMGAFYVDLRPGRHFVQVKREGYATQLVSVTIPRDSGRRVMVFLRDATKGASVLEAIALIDMDARLNRRNAAYSSLVTREDIAKGPWHDLHQIAVAHSSRPIQPDCEVTIAGTNRREFLWAIDASEIEAVEVYRPRQQRMTVTSINSGGRTIQSPQSINQPFVGGNCGGHSVYVWLRK